MLEGPDVSFYQEEIDFDKMKANGAKFVIVRVGQKNWPDPKFVYNWKASRESGLPRGSYWFYDSRETPKNQAKMWVEMLGDDLGELPMFADIEEEYRGQYSGWHSWYDFLEYAKELTVNKEICIYTAPYYWKDNAPRNSAELNYFAQYPLWIANYGVKAPAIPQPWSEYLFWQYTTVGDGNGYGTQSKGLDLNRYPGTEAEFNRRFGLSDEKVLISRVRLVVDRTDNTSDEFVLWRRK